MLEYREQLAACRPTPMDGTASCDSPTRLPVVQGADDETTTEQCCRRTPPRRQQCSSTLQPRGSSAELLDRCRKLRQSPEELQRGLHRSQSSPASPKLA